MWMTDQWIKTVQLQACFAIYLKQAIKPEKFNWNNFSRRNSTGATFPGEIQELPVKAGEIQEFQKKVRFFIWCKNSSAFGLAGSCGNHLLVN